jgi:hypothetical protein
MRSSTEATPLSGVQSVRFVGLNVSFHCDTELQTRLEQPGMPCVPVFAAVHESGHGTDQRSVRLMFTAGIGGEADSNAAAR